MRFFKKFITWWGWTIQKKTFLGIIISLILLAVCMALDNFLLPSLSFMIGPIFVSFLAIDMIVTVLTGFYYTDSQKNYRFAIYEADKKMSEIEKLFGEITGEFKYGFIRIMERIKLTLDPTELNEWMSQLKLLMKEKKDLTDLMKQKKKRDVETKEERAKRLIKEEEDGYQALLKTIEMTKTDIQFAETKLFQANRDQ